MKALGLDVEPSPEGTWIRVERHFGVRLDAEPPGLTAWRDGSRMGLIARFDDVERMAASIRSVRRWSCLHAVGVTLLGLAGLVFMAILYWLDVLARVGWLGPIALAIGLLLVVGWPLEARSRRAMQRSSLANELLAWRRKGGLGPLKGPPP